MLEDVDESESTNAARFCISDIQLSSLGNVPVGLGRSGSPLLNPSLSNACLILFKLLKSCFASPRDRPVKNICIDDFRFNTLLVVAIYIILVQYF